MPVDLSAIEETCSFLVPAYGITPGALVALSEFDRARCIGPAQGADETYELMQRDDWYLQPRGTVHFLFGASALCNEAIGPIGERRVIRLREAADPLPAELANTCLMVQGMRTCARRRQDRSEIVHGYGAWAETSTDHRWISDVTVGDPAGTVTRIKSISFGRAGRGALYAPVDDGKARILLLDFHIADRDEASPDLLLAWSSCTEVRAGGIPHLDPRGERLDDAWHALIMRAIDGYTTERGP